MKRGMVFTNKAYYLKNVGTPMGSAVSLGIHESQSRMWEKSSWEKRSVLEVVLSKDE